MSSPLEQVDELHRYIRELQKIGTKMEAGQFLAAFRSLKRIEAELDQARQAIIDKQGTMEAKKTEIKGDSSFPNFPTGNGLSD